MKNYLLDNPNKKRRLEKYVHSKVEEVFAKTIKSTPKSKSIVLEVPRKEDIKKALKLNQNFNYQENKKKATYVIKNDKNIAHLNKELSAIFSYK